MILACFRGCIFMLSLLYLVLNGVYERSDTVLSFHGNPHIPPFSYRFDAPEALIELLELLVDQQILPMQAVEELVDHYLMPRLRTAVSEWSPSPRGVPVHTWLHPWLPLLKAKLSQLYPEIRRKLEKTFDTWDILDPKLQALLQPWVGVFDSSSFCRFLVRAAVPRLVVAMQNLDYTSCDVRKASSLLGWHSLLPTAHFEALFLGEFFPRWLGQLQGKLDQLLPNNYSNGTTSAAEKYSTCSGAVEWYKSWRGVFPQNLLLPDTDAGSGFRQPFTLALDMMHGSMEGNMRVLQGSPYAPHICRSSRTYFTLIQQLAKKSKKEETQQQMAKARHRATASNVSFKDLVARFALEKGIEFAPLAGKMEAGHQLYVIGTHKCYLHQDVLFSRKGGKGWWPIALEDVLGEMSE